MFLPQPAEDAEKFTGICFQYPSCLVSTPHTDFFGRPLPLSPFKRALFVRNGRWKDRSD